MQHKGNYCSSSVPGNSEGAQKMNSLSLAMIGIHLLAFSQTCPMCPCLPPKEREKGLFCSNYGTIITTIRTFVMNPS